MALGGFVDWRGNTINREVHGGVRAAWFLYGKQICTESLFQTCLHKCMVMQQTTSHRACFQVSEFKTLKHFCTFPLAVLTVVTNVVIVPNLLNMVTYLQGTMHMGVSGSATTATNFFGATSGFALIGAFLSDSYITRSRTVLIFGPFMFLVICIFDCSVICINLYFSLMIQGTIFPKVTSAQQ